ncbi:hypothetical protein FHN55_16070 [Streptomyces sp. NP160]|uniref:SIR2 family protein n=1 Tax=Streptomyces sp. NP160 TaxID=2586637 RepID=UPI0011197EB9|nr:SIR2 family protein [Streptomyces sp. NP160]TNM63188.1 hypothetical protein FHN55_16070 [Streptomyces sp. NP160]
MGDVMVILGAGATYDCLEQERADRFGVARPPLAAQLFDERSDFVEVLRRVPQALSIVQRMRRLAPLGGGVEEALNRVVQRAEETRDPMYLQDVLALRFYLREIIIGSTAPISAATAGATNYLDLVTRLHDYSLDSGSRVTFVTFNYDNLLESAIANRFSYRFSNTDSYINAPIAIFKPHGSVDWVDAIPLSKNVPSRSPYMHVASVKSAEHLDTTRKSAVLMYDEAKLGSGWEPPEVIAPAIAIPITSKDAFLLPDGHERDLAQRMVEVDTLLIIGWRASEAAFKELARTNLRSAGYQDIRAFVVDKADSRISAGVETIRNFSPHLSSGNTATSELGFSGFLDDGRSHPRLSEWGRFIEHVRRSR